MRFLHTLLIATTAVVLPACGGDHEGHGDEDGNEHAESAGEHSHAAPRAEVGGQLVELGEHYAQMEVVPDFETGEVHLYFMDGHAESPVRLTQASVQFTLTLGEEVFEFTLAAQASTLTGETVGDTSEFLGQDDRLKGVEGFTTVVKELDVLGTPFSSVPITYSKGDH